MLFISESISLSIAVSTSVNFKGLDYVEWTPLQMRRSSEANEIALRFKTLEPSGVLIYIGNSTNYLIVELYRGQLLVGLRLDSGKPLAAFRFKDVVSLGDQIGFVRGNLYVLPVQWVEARTQSRFRVKCLSTPTPKRHCA